jgi:hypothetical protein
MWTLIILLVLVLIRTFELRLFIKKTVRACHLYDCKHAAKQFEIYGNGALVEEMVNNKEYHKAKWSAFRFVFLEGPSIMTMFFSLKPLTIKRQYDKRVVDKLNEYAIA